MARSDSTRALERIEIEELWHSTRHTGAGDDLIAAGLVTRAQLPGYPECPHKTGYAWRAPDGRRWRTWIRQRRNKQVVAYCVDRLCTAAERRQREAEDKHAVATERATAEIKALPQSRDDYARRLNGQAAALATLWRGFLTEPLGGCYVPRDALEAFVDAMGEALHELIENIRFDPKRHERAIAAIQRKAALAEPTFRRFMDAATARRES